MKKTNRDRTSGPVGWVDGSRDEQAVSAIWGRQDGPSSIRSKAGSQGRRAELILYPLVCACGLFGVLTHYWTALQPPQASVWVWQECLRWVGLS